MRIPLIVLIGAAVLPVARAELLPVEDFSHEDAYYGPVLAPDGKAVAYGETVKGENRVFVRDLVTTKKFGIDLEGRDGAWTQGSSFFWANNNRLVFTAHGRRSAIDRDGTHARYALFGGAPVYLFRNEEGTMLLKAFELATGTGMSRVGFYYPNRPFLVRVNTRTGEPMRAVENPGNVVAWGVNPQGVTTVAEEIKGTQYRTIFRPTEDSPWETLAGLDWGDPQVRPIAFSADGATLYLSRISPTGTWGLYPYDLAKRKLGAAILENERYDILPGHDLATGNGILVQAPIYTPDFRSLLGIRYMTDYPKTVWLNERMAQVQAALDQALPQKINTVVSVSDDLQQAVVFSWTATDPGTYYIFDGAAGKLEKFLRARPWVDPAKMSDVFPMRFKARDGLLINGYITFPKGREQKNLPLVVLPHGDPFTRSTWSFDSTAQFLANRGYAVLQINQRGSSGYGENFRDAAKKKFGREVEQDLADGVHWAVRQGYADPKRVGIIGFGTFGGYTAMMSLVVEPDLYCCGISSAGVTDLVKVIDKSDMDPDVYNYLTEWVGDPATEKQRLREISPINLADKIKVPTLVIHDDQDDPWAYNQNKTLVANLKKAGRESELLHKFDDLHYGYERHARWLTEIEAFFGKHMPANSPAAAK